MRRHTRVVSRLRVEKKVLVQQRIAHVIAVGQIVDDENAPDVRLNDAFPARIQRVVIDDQPVGTVACTQHRGCLGRVQLLRHRQPRGVCERRAPVRLEIGGGRGNGFEGVHGYAQGRDQKLANPLRKSARGKLDARAAFLQCMRKRHAARKVSAAHGGRRITANHHTRHSADPEDRLYRRSEKPFSDVAGVERFTHPVHASRWARSS